MYSSSRARRDPHPDAVPRTDPDRGQPTGDPLHGLPELPGRSRLTLPSSSAGLSVWASTVARRTSSRVRGSAARPDRRNPSVVIAHLVFSRVRVT